MRFFRSIFILAVLVLTSGLHALEVERAWNRFYEKEEFQRISEFFTGEEVSGPRLLARSQADTRTGQYFVVKFDESLDTLGSTATAELVVYSTESKEPIVHNYEFETKDTARLFLGLTGSDWPEGKPDVLAWRLIVRDSDEAEVGRHESFLWDLPTTGESGDK